MKLCGLLCGFQVTPVFYLLVYFIPLRKVSLVGFFYVYRTVLFLLKYLQLAFCSHRHELSKLLFVLLNLLVKVCTVCE